MNYPLLESSKSAYLELKSMPRTNQIAPGTPTPGTPVKPNNFNSPKSAKSKPKKKSSTRSKSKYASPRSLSQSAIKSKKPKKLGMVDVPDTFCANREDRIHIRDQPCQVKKKSTKHDNLKDLRCAQCGKRVFSIEVLHRNISFCYPVNLLNSNEMLSECL